MILFRKTIFVEYFHKTDMLYIRFKTGVCADAEEAADGVVLDFDKNQKIIGVEIEDAGKKFKSCLSDHHRLYRRHRSKRPVDRKKKE